MLLVTSNSNTYNFNRNKHYKKSCLEIHESHTSELQQRHVEELQNHAEETSKLQNALRKIESLKNENTEKDRNIATLTAEIQDEISKVSSNLFPSYKIAKYSWKQTCFWNTG